MEPDKGNRKIGRDLKYFHGEAVATSVENAGAAYQAPSLVASGTGAQDIAFLSTLTNLIFSIILIKIPSILNSRGSLRRMVLIFSFLNILTWVPLILVLFFFGNVAPIWLIGLWFISLLPTLLIGPLRDNWLAESVPAPNMGRYLSIRSAISGIMYLGVFYFMGYILSVSGGYIFKGYALVLFMAFTGSIACFVLYKVIRPPANEPDSHSGEAFHFVDFLRTARHGQLGKFILYVSLLSFAVYLCSAYFTVYMLRDLCFGYMTYTIVVSGEFLARIVSLTFWGKLVDRLGSLKVMRIASLFIPLVPVLWLFSYHIVYLVLIQLLSGTVWAAFDLCNQTYVYREAPPEKRLRYIVYHRSLSTFSMAMGALVGAFVLPFVFPVFGSQILGLFLVSGALRLVIVVAMYPRQSGRTVALVVESSEGVSAPVRQAPAYISPRLGLYRHPECWAAKPVATRFACAVSGIDTVAPQGVYYRPQEWAEYLKPARRLTTQKIVSPYRGLYYRPAEWRKYIEQTSVCQPAVCRYDVEKLMAQPLVVTLPPKSTRLIPVTA